MANKVIKGQLNEIDDRVTGSLAEQLAAEGVEDGVDCFMPQLTPNADVAMLRDAAREVVSPPHTVESARV